MYHMGMYHMYAGGTSVPVLHPFRFREVKMAPNTLPFLRGTLDVLILRTLSGGTLHGYDLSRRIGALSQAAFQVEEGVLYPALRRLENKGWLQAAWGQTETGREARFYEITPAGRRHLTDQLAMWKRYVYAMSLVLYPETAEP